MTEVLDTAEVGRPRRDRDERRLVDPDLVDRLIADAREHGVDVAGEGGLFAQLAKTVMERSLAAELTDHLGYEEGDPAGNGSGNSRNGTTPKRLATEVGKGQRRREGIDTLVVGLYGRGLTLSAIQAQLKETFDLDVSRELVSKITDSVMDEVREWQARPLEAVYPVIFLDALVCKVRENGSVRNKAAHLAVGVNMEGKEVLETSRRVRRLLWLGGSGSWDVRAGTRWSCGSARSGWSSRLGRTTTRSGRRSAPSRASSGSARRRPCGPGCAGKRSTLGAGRESRASTRRSSSD